MTPTTAIRLIGLIRYRPKWVITAADMTDRFEDGVRLNIEYPALNANREDAEEGYVTERISEAAFIMLVGPFDEIELYREVLKNILCVEEHEAREFLRVSPTFWAPFHPHHKDGMERWGKPEYDLRFGIA